jgi:biotin operon repressor/predicted phosphodiesterase
MPWREEVKSLYRQNSHNFPWEKTAREFSIKYGQNVTPDALRGVCRRSGQVAKHCGGVKPVLEPPTQREGQVGFNAEKFLSLVGKNAVSLPDLAKMFDCSERVVQANIQDLQESGWDITNEGNVFSLNRVIGKEQKPVVENWNGERRIKFGFVSDTHLCSMSQQLTHLNSFYDRLAAEEIDTVYHSGDVVDGDDVYPGHKFEVFKFGADNQRQYAVEQYPYREGITTKFITGNHDLKYYTKLGYDIGEGIANERKDMVYLGQYFARVQITPRCILQIEHPLGKPAYAVSYKTQRKIDNMRGGDKPNILMEGHYHYSDYLFRRNVHAICCPSFQGPTKFSKRLGLESDNGAYIIELLVDAEGSVSEFTPRFYPFYVLKHNDY